MKSKITFLALFLLSSLLLMGCNGQSEKQEASASNLQTTIVGGRTGGAWSVFTEGIAESIRRNHEGSMITVEPGSLIENPIIVAEATVPYGMSYAMTAYASYTGMEPYDQAYEDLRAISVVIPANYYQFFVQGDLPFDTIDEIIKEKYPLRLAVDQKGAAGELITREIFNQHGVTYDELISWGGSVDYLAGSQAFEMMSDNRMDATGDAESAPSGNILEAATMTDFQMLTLEDETIQGVASELGLKEDTVSKEAYEFLEKDIPTVSTPAILITHKDVSTDEVYEVTKSIYNHLDYLYTVHEEFKSLSGEKMVQVGQLPLHPGAEKFYSEKGLLD